MDNRVANRRMVFDVTTLLRWQRSPVGIVRTQLELCRSLLNDLMNIEVVFVSFNDERNSLEIINATQVKEALNKIDSF